MASALDVRDNAVAARTSRAEDVGVPAYERVCALEIAEDALVLAAVLHQ
jgi:hypothetical protein